MVRVAQVVQVAQVEPEEPVVLAERAGSVLGTLGDAYANPVMVDALIHSREGTIVVPETPPKLYDPAPPAIDDPTQMERWEPWVRAYIGDRRDDARHQLSGSGQRIPGQVIRLWTRIPDCGNSDVPRKRPSSNRFHWS